MNLIQNRLITPPPPRVLLNKQNRLIPVVVLCAFLASLGLAACQQPSGGGGSDNPPTGSSSGDNTKGNLIGTWEDEDGFITTFTATTVTLNMEPFGSASGPYTLSGSTLTCTITSGTGLAVAMGYIGKVITKTMKWIDANTIEFTDNDDGKVSIDKRIK
jgi:hypothetical protein